MFMDRKTQYCQAVSSFQLELQIQCNLNQNLSKSFLDINKLIPKFIWKGKRPRKANPILNMKNKAGKLTLANFKTYSKTTVIKTIDIG